MKELDTKRLKLRYLKGGDYVSLYDAWSDDEVTKFLAFDTYESIEEAKERVGIWLDRYKDEKCYRWIIERKDDGELFGVIDVVNFDGDGIPHIGYLSRRRMWGNGYMTEALGAVTEYLFSWKNQIQLFSYQFLQVFFVICTCDVFTQRSIDLLLLLDFS